MLIFVGLFTREVIGPASRNHCDRRWLLRSTSLGAASCLLTGAYDLLLHSDVRIPRWLGYVLTRPKQHTVHHAHEHHAQNYGLPVWDLLFGTWANPAERMTKLGFDDDKAERIRDMLMCCDVDKSVAGDS